MKNYQPPKLAERFFSWFHSKADIEDLLGDLEEIYQIQARKRGRFYASCVYWLQIFRFLFSYASAKRKKDAAYAPQYNSAKGLMFRNYMKISFRNLWKYRTFSILNVAGLALGMSLSLLALAMYVELLRFDTFHEDAEDIYRITTTVTESGDKTSYASSPSPLAYQCESQLSSINQSVKINDYFFPVVQTAGDPIRLSGYLTEPSFLEMFDFPLLKGNANALENPNQVIITYELAQKLFGEKEALNKILKTESSGQLKVAGILQPFPKNTHFEFDLLGSLGTIHPKPIENWVDFRSNYFYFKSRARSSELKNQINLIADLGTPFFEESGKKVTYDLQPITGINPGPDLDDNLGVIFDRPTMFFFFGLCLIILISACLNYVNMSIGNALKRSKEIGIRKVMGSQSRQIVHQFLVETVIICLLAVVFSFFIFNAVRGEYLSMLAGASSLSLTPDLTLIVVFIAFAIATGILTGLVPASYFSRVSPIEALRKSHTGRMISISGIRKTLMVVQFMLSLVFMIGIGVLVRQYAHTLTYDLGFHKENILVVPVTGENIDLLRNEFMTLADVKKVSFSSSIPGTPLSGVTYFYSEDRLDSIRGRELFVDADFIEHMGLNILSGNSTLKKSATEELIINEKLAGELKNLNRSSDDQSRIFFSEDQGKIVGVIENYNHEPLNQRIEPMVLRLDESRLTQALVSVSSDHIGNTIYKLEESWSKVNPNVPFRATFLDDEIEKAYDFFITGLKIFGFLAILAITISSIGLLGMVIYYTENRTKEVAVRKVLGASGKNLIYSLSGLFFRLWGIAIVIAVPLSVLFYDRVFVSIYNKFSEGVGYPEIVLSTLLTVGIGLSAILWQTYKVMRVNPVVYLRNE